MTSPVISTLSPEQRIVVVADHQKAFKFWLRHHIIGITNPGMVERLCGQKIFECFQEGERISWMTDRHYHEILARMRL